MNQDTLTKLLHNIITDMFQVNSFDFDIEDQMIEDADQYSKLYILNILGVPIRCDLHVKENRIIFDLLMDVDILDLVHFPKNASAKTITLKKDEMWNIYKSAIFDTYNEVLVQFLHSSLIHEINLFDVNSEYSCKKV